MEKAQSMNDAFLFEDKPGETPLEDLSGLLLKHVRTREALNRAEFSNNNKVLSKYFLKELSSAKAPFHYAWLLELHKEMFGEVWDWAGKVRSSGVNIGIEPVKIPSELHRALYDLNGWEKEGMPAAEIAGRLHHRLVWIHPFTGGNGRWARMVLDIYLMKTKGARMNWPDHESQMKAFREKYIAALKAADLSDFKPIVDLHRSYFSE